MGDHDDAVPGRDPEEGDEADERSDREHSTAEPGGDDTSDERERKVDHHDE
ncbi:hypothetical protein D3C83_317340 [compost metagenome]